VKIKTKKRFKGSVQIFIEKIPKKTPETKTSGADSMYRGLYEQVWPL